MRLLAAVLVDLENAFGKVPRSPTWERLRHLAADLGFDLVWLQTHDSTRYLLNHTDGRIARRLLVQKGLRQGSADGPIVFVV